MKTWLLVWAATLVVGTTVLAQDVAPPKDAAKPAEVAKVEMRVPVGFKGAEDTTAEPYTKTGWAKEIVHEATGIAMVYVPAGEFIMGSPVDEVGHYDSETQHRVKLTRGFYLGKYEVTQGQWEAEMGNNPSSSEQAGRDAAVGLVSWDDCQAFCRKLGDGFRLPTEAEWEYACRAGTATAFNDGTACTVPMGQDAAPDRLGWYNENEYRAHRVGQKNPNAWGLHDMHGNVWEWCADRYGDYGAGLATDPGGPAAGERRVIRGGGYNLVAKCCRSAYRYGYEPGERIGALGCRLAFSPDWPPDTK